MAVSTTGVPMTLGCGGYQSTTLPPYCITTYNTTSCYSNAPKYYTTKEPECYTTTNAAPAYYTEAPQHNTTKALEYYTTTYHGREKVKEFSSRVSISVTAIGTAVHYLSITSFFVALQVLNKVNYGVVLLLGVVSLMVGSAMVYRHLLVMVGTNNNIRNNRLLH
ncbi:uncharacterized protein LOC124198620 [Daphnia pulex]|uniref:uncharacterized protein LOC124198620 n=1 Tax=Daphnia pulex TaxID=6669 RepID=UPI001EDF9C9E|nr:uncharacterized protein LOC124198620 [Daphnia pulex]XP_046450507.1 uncharacterized protein LOC124198620 [Daphnia pulex]XP_046450508.1 uncharacterized protein LOC124198620 [Daphnia pulex]